MQPKDDTQQTHFTRTLFPQAPTAANPPTGPSPMNGAIAQANARRIERTEGQGLYGQANTGLAELSRTALEQAFPNTITAFRGADQNIREAYQTGDAYRGAWQRQAPGGLRNAGQSALDLYNAEQQVRGLNISAERQPNGTMAFSGSAPAFAAPAASRSVLDTPAAPGSNPAFQRSVLAARGESSPGAGEMRGGTVNTIPAAAFASAGPAASRAVSAALNAAAERGDWDAVRGIYQRDGGTWRGRTAEQDAAESQGPSGGAIGSSRFGLKFMRRSEDRAADRAQAAEHAREESRLARERLFLDSQRVGADVQRAQGELEQQGRIRTLQDQLIAEQDPTKRAQFERTLGIISGKDSAGQPRVIYDEELIDPAQPMAGVRRTPMVLNPDGTATRIRAGNAPRELPAGISGDAALQAAQRAIASGVDPELVAARLREFGLSMKETGR